MSTSELDDLKTYLKALVSAKYSGNEILFRYAIINRISYQSLPSMINELDISTANTLFTNINCSNPSTPQRLCRYLFVDTGLVSSADFSFLTSNVSSLTGTVSDHTGSIANILSSVLANAASISTNTANIASMADNMESISSLTGTVSSHTGSISGLSSSITVTNANVVTNTQSISAHAANLLKVKYHNAFLICGIADKALNNKMIDTSMRDDLKALRVSSDSLNILGISITASQAAPQDTCVSYLLCYINQVAGKGAFLGPTKLGGSIDGDGTDKGSNLDYPCPVFDTTCKGWSSLTTLCDKSDSATGPFDSLCLATSDYFAQLVASELCSALI